MKFPIKVRLVVAGNRQQFEEWRRANGVTPNDLFVRYVRTEEQLRGLRNCEVVYVGSYWESPVFGSWRLVEVTKEA